MKLPSIPGVGPSASTDPEMAPPRPKQPKRLRRSLFVAAAGFLLVWLTFFDSHSFFRRATWHYERAELSQQNEELQVRIDEIEASLERGLTAEDVERIAREEYGMRRPGETVYPEPPQQP